MKKLMYTLLTTLSLCLSAHADIVLSNLTSVVSTETRVITVTTTNKLPVATAKAVWTAFSIAYIPPAYTQAIYSVSYVLVDTKTKREIPASKGVQRMTEKEVFAFALSKGIDFNQMGQGIGYLLNEYLKTKFETPAVVE
jgi:hypothetical protein